MTTPEPASKVSPVCGDPLSIRPADGSWAPAHARMIRTRRPAVGSRRFTGKAAIRVRRLASSPRSLAGCSSSAPLFAPCSRCCRENSLGVIFLLVGSAAAASGCAHLQRYTATAPPSHGDRVLLRQKMGGRPERGLVVVGICLALQATGAGADRPGLAAWVHAPGAGVGAGALRRSPAHQNAGRVRAGVGAALGARAQIKFADAVEEVLVRKWDKKKVTRVVKSWRRMDEEYIHKEFKDEHETWQVRICGGCVRAPLRSVPATGPIF